MADVEGAEGDMLTNHFCKFGCNQSIQAFVVDGLEWIFSPILRFTFGESFWQSHPSPMARLATWIEAAAEAGLGEAIGKK